MKNLKLLMLALVLSATAHSQVTQTRDLTVKGFFKFTGLKFTGATNDTTDFASTDNLIPTASAVREYLAGRLAGLPQPTPDSAMWKSNGIFTGDRTFNANNYSQRFSYIRSATYETDTFKIVKGNGAQRIRLNIHAADGTLLDGIMANYSTIYSDAVDGYDIHSLSAWCWLKRSGVNLVIERRNVASATKLTDTLYLEMNNSYWNTALLDAIGYMEIPIENIPGKVRLVDVAKGIDSVLPVRPYAGGTARYYFTRADGGLGMRFKLIVEYQKPVTRVYLQYPDTTASPANMLTVDPSTFEVKVAAVPSGGGGSTDTTSLSNRINSKVNISDTATMLAGYARTGSVNNSLQTAFANTYASSSPTFVDIDVDGSVYKNLNVQGLSALDFGHTSSGPGDSDWYFSLNGSSTSGLGMGSSRAGEWLNSLGNDADPLTGWTLRASTPDSGQSEFRVAPGKIRWWTPGPLIVNNDAGTAGQVLTSQGASAAPTWTTVSSGGSMVYPATGIAVSNGSGWVTSRTITGSSYINVANGNGGAGNPTISITGTIPVGNGGTGRNTSTTAYGIIAAGTNATAAQQTIAPGTSGQFLKSAGASALASFATITKTDVGLANVDNTSDANKPVSTATQTALNLKVNIADTATMLAPYATTAELTAAQVEYVFAQGLYVDDTTVKAKIVSVSDSGIATPAMKAAWDAKLDAANAFVAITYGSTSTWAWSGTAMNKTLTLTGNATLAITGDADGSYGTLLVTQDATGGRTLTLPAGDNTTGLPTITTTAGAKTLYTYVRIGSTRYWNATNR